MRLINADALMREVVIKFYTTPYFNHISKMIEDAPTIESVKKDELIRAIQEIVYDGEDCAKLIDMVDRLST